MLKLLKMSGEMKSFCENCKNKDEGICTDCIYCEYQQDLYDAKDKRKTRFDDNKSRCENCKNKNEGICTDCIYCKFQQDLFEIMED